MSDEANNGSEPAIRDGLSAIEELKLRPQWVGWKYVHRHGSEKATKPPIDPHRGSGASHSKPSTWGSYKQATMAVERYKLAGVGYVLSNDDDYTGIDLDKCRDPISGRLAAWADDIVALKETYCEVSPSGTGLRLIVRGKIAETIKCDPAHVEIYRSQRYLTITGDHIAGTPVDIRPAPKTLEALRKRVKEFAPKEEQSASQQTAKDQRQEPFGQKAYEKRKREAGAGFFRNVNSAALANAGAWAMLLYPSAKFQPGSGGYRVSSQALGREHEEDLSIHPLGIRDWGVHDMGDPRRGARTPIDLVLEQGVANDAVEAALWLCERLGKAPEAFGWKEEYDNDEQSANELPAGESAFIMRGLADGPLCYAGSREDAQSIAAATGFEVHVHPAGFRRLHEIAPPGRQILICAKDFKRSSASDKAVTTSYSRLRTFGFDVRVASPFYKNRGKGEGFAVLAKESGLAAVRERILLAADATPFEENDISLSDARTRIEATIGDFFAAAKKWKPAFPFIVGGKLYDFSDVAAFFNPPPVHAIGITVGAGKTQAALEKIVDALIEMRLCGDKRLIIMALPEHKLSAEIAKRFKKLVGQMLVKRKQDQPGLELELRCDVWRGRDAEQPDNSGRKMCVHEEMPRATKLLAQDELCRPCGLQITGCPYINQRGHCADLWIVSHQALFHKPPPPIEGCGIAAVIIDESLKSAGLEGVDPSDRIEIDVNSLTSMHPAKDVWGRDPARDPSAKLVMIRHMLKDALIAYGPLSRSALLDAGLTIEDAIFAEKAEYLRVVRDGDWRERTDNASIRSMTTLWRAVTALLDDDGPAECGRIEFLYRQGHDGQRGADLLGVTGRRSIHDEFCAPTLLLDGTPSIDPVRLLLPQLVDRGMIDVAAPFMTLRQLASKSWAKSSTIESPADENSVAPLSPSQQRKALQRAKQRTTARNNLADLRAIISREARKLGGKTLVIANKALIEALNLPEHFVTGHFNAIAGRDEWRDVRLAIIIGRTMPPPQAVELAAAAMTGKVPAKASGWYDRVDAYRLERGVDGRVARVLTKTEQHPDELCEAIRRRSSEGEIVQAIGRVRGVNRTRDNPVEALVLTDVILPLVVDEALPDSFGRPGPIDLQLGAGYIAFLGGSAAHGFYPDLFPSQEAAKRALQRDGWGGVTQDDQSGTFSYEKLLKENVPLCPGCVTLRFQRVGERLHVEYAIYDPVCLANPRAAIEERLGRLAMFEIAGQEPDRAEPDRAEGAPHGQGLLAVLREALSSGIAQWVVIRGRSVFAVARDALRGEFKRGRPSDEKPGTTRQAFNRWLNTALAANLAETGNVDGQEFVWLAQSSKPEAAPAMAPEADVLPLASISNAVIVDDPPPRDTGPTSNRSGVFQRKAARLTASQVEQEIQKSTVLRVWRWLISPKQKMA